MLVRILKKTLKYILIVLSIPVLYLVIALLGSAITVNNNEPTEAADKILYISTNGIHLEVIIPVEDLMPELSEGLIIDEARYLSFGWGEENFYINTPTWADLTFKNAMRSLFLKNQTLVHITRYSGQRTDWVTVKVNAEQLQKINSFISDSFQLDGNKSKQLLAGQGYGPNDDFYRAMGRYSCFKTCNTWVNSAFKESGLKSCLWTPFDFGLLNKYD